MLEFWSLNWLPPRLGLWSKADNAGVMDNLGQDMLVWISCRSPALTRPTYSHRGHAPSYTESTRIDRLEVNRDAFSVGYEEPAWHLMRRHSAILIVEVVDWPCFAWLLFGKSVTVGCGIEEALCGPCFTAALCQPEFWRQRMVQNCRQFSLASAWINR